MDSGEWSSVSAIAAALAALVAAFQLIQLRIDARKARRAELSSVAVITHVARRPSNSRTPGVDADWIYSAEVVNPGRLPITNVDLQIIFPGDVRRIHHDRTAEPSNRVLSFYVPVIAPNASKHWDRTIRMDGSVGARIKETFATVSFSSPDAGRMRLRWPPE